jgi:hypothetical protein
MRLMDMKIRMLVIPPFIEEIDGFYGFVSIEFVRFGIGSCVREIRGFTQCKSLHRIEIPSSTEIVSGFHSCDSLTEVMFESNNRIREIHAFDHCKSLPEIEIPASLEILRGFNHCSKLTKIVFPPAGRVQVVEGFLGCLISSIEIPALVESIIGFDTRWLSQVVVAEGTVIKTIKVGNLWPPVNGRSDPVFVGYGDKDLRKSRSRLHLM